MYPRLKLNALMAAVALAGCSSSDVDTTTAAAPAPAPAPAPLSGPAAAGIAYKGPLSGATLCVYKVDNNLRGGAGDKITLNADSKPTVVDGCVVTGTSGDYTLVIPKGTTGDLIIVSTGGTFCSDETAYNGSTCAGGGTPIAMGSLNMRTIIAAPADGVIASAPLSLLTTAAARLKETTSARFAQNFATIAANFGISGSTASTTPTVAPMQGVLAKLAAYLDGDTSVFQSVIDAISNGDLTGSGTLASASALSCSALDSTDTATTYGMSKCEPDGSGTYRRVYYDYGSNILDGTARTGRTAYVYGGYTDSSCSGSYQTNEYVPLSAQYTGTTTLALSASSNASVSQSGPVSKFSFTVAPSTLLGNSATTTFNHLFCRTQAGTGSCGGQPRGYLTATSSRVKDGYLSRIDSSSEVTTYCD